MTECRPISLVTLIFLLPYAILFQPTLIHPAQSSWEAWFQPDAGVPISVRRRTVPNQFAKSGYYTEIDLRGDSKEEFRFDLALELPDGRKLAWRANFIAFGQTTSFSVDSTSISKIDFKNAAVVSANRYQTRPGKALWQTADIILPKGTRSVRWHLEDPYTYSQDRGVYVSLVVEQNAVELRPTGLTANFGWGTHVYPDNASTKAKGNINPQFFFGKGTMLSVPNEMLVEGVSTADGEVWDLRIDCTAVKIRDFFGFNGLDGLVVVDEPKPTGARHSTFKAGLSGFARVRFAVAE